METAKDIFDRIVGKHHRELSPMNYENTMKFAQEIAEMVYKEAYSDGKYAGKYPGDWPYYEWDKQGAIQKIFPSSEPVNSSPVSSGTPCTFKENPDRVTPL